MTFTTNDPNEIINQGVEDSVRSHAMQYAKLTEKNKKWFKARWRLWLYNCRNIYKKK